MRLQNFVCPVAEDIHPTIHAITCFSDKTGWKVRNNSCDLRTHTLQKSLGQLKNHYSSSSQKSLDVTPGMISLPIKREEAAY